MENKEFPEQEELLPIEQEVFPPEDPSYEEDALPDEDLLLMDGSEAPEEAPAQEMLPLFPQEEVSEAEEFTEEPPMSDEAFLAFMPAVKQPIPECTVQIVLLPIPCLSVWYLAAELQRI